VVQAFRSQGCGDAELCRSATRDRSLQQVGDEVSGLFEDFRVRA